MNKLIVLDDRKLEEAEIIGEKRFQNNKKHQKTMSWNLKKMKDASRDILGAQGEIAFDQWCTENNLFYNSDHENTQCRTTIEDQGDGTIFINQKPYSVEIKTTTASNPHLIIPQYQLEQSPKDIYVLIKKTANSKFKILGFTVPEQLEDFFDDTCTITCNTCYRMCNTHLIQDWEDFINTFFPISP